MRSVNSTCTQIAAILMSLCLGANALYAQESICRPAILHPKSIEVGYSSQALNLPIIHAFHVAFEKKKGLSVLREESRRFPTAQKPVVLEAAISGFIGLSVWSALPDWAAYALLGLAGVVILPDVMSIFVQAERSGKEGLTVLEIGQLRNIQKPAVQDLVHRLMNAGYLIRKQQRIHYGNVYLYSIAEPYKSQLDSDEIDYSGTLPAQGPLPKLNSERVKQLIEQHEGDLKAIANTLSKEGFAGISTIRLYHFIHKYPDLSKSLETAQLAVAKKRNAEDYHLPSTLTPQILENRTLKEGQRVKTSIGVGTVVRLTNNRIIIRIGTSEREFSYQSIFQAPPILETITALFVLALLPSWAQAVALSGLFVTLASALWRRGIPLPSEEERNALADYLELPNATALNRLTIAELYTLIQAVNYQKSIQKIATALRTIPAHIEKIEKTAHRKLSPNPAVILFTESLGPIRQQGDTLFRTLMESESRIRFIYELLTDNWSIEVMEKTGRLLLENGIGIYYLAPMNQIRIERRPIQREEQMSYRRRYARPVPLNSLVDVRWDPISRTLTIVVADSAYQALQAAGWDIWDSMTATANIRIVILPQSKDPGNNQIPEIGSGSHPILPIRTNGWQKSRSFLQQSA
jgi:hypothetical protein